LDFEVWLFWADIFGKLISPRVVFSQKKTLH
jgi:hypothetical protein